jgi:hypothetical protein
MGVVSLLEAIMGTSVDLKGLETGLQKAETMAKEGAEKITSHFSLMAVGIATAMGGAVLVALEKAIRTTAEWGLEMEHLSNRMGMTTREAATLVGVMERFGVNANLGARAMQMLSTQVTATQNSLDPFATRLGRVLGSLRDTSGQALSMTQVLDKVREKVSSASTDSDKLKVATELLGARIGGQLVPMLKLSNDEWDRQKKSVEGTLGPVEQAAEAALKYKQATAELEQSVRHLQVELGTRLLPTFTKFIDSVSATAKAMGTSGGWFGNADKIIGNFYDNIRKTREETAETTKESERLAEASEKVAQEIELTEQNERKVVALTRERLSLEEKAMSLGLSSDIRGAAAGALAKLEEQRIMLQKQLSAGLTDDQRLKIETEIMKIKVEEAEVVKNSNAAIYKREEEAIKLARELRLASVDQEIAYRKQKSGELLGRGDVFGAAEELIKARDLAEKQQDQIFEFTKKIRVVSIQNEIEFQKQKLEQVKGNAEEEMKVLTKIADLDKDLYDKRLDFSLSYTKSVVDAYSRVMEASKKTGDVETFEHARIDSERKLVEGTREAGQVLHGGGTVEQREAAVQFAQFVNKQIEQMQQMGTHVSGIWQDAASTAKDILRAASGGEAVRSPGGPSPTIGSLLSPAEGLATEGLARGSDIPRLDTSFTDLAVRVRDVLLGAIPNIQNFSNAVQSAALSVAKQTGFALNPGIIGPGGGGTTLPTQGSGQLATSGETIAPPTSGPSGATTGTPTPQVGIGRGTGVEDATKALTDATKALQDAIKLTTSVASQASSADERNQFLADVVDAIKSSSSRVQISIDPGTGDLIANSIAQAISQ